MEVIRVTGLTKSFGEVRALHDVSVEFPGGAVGLLGPNGAGKTTLLKILLGLLPADEGQAEVLGLDAMRSPLDLRQRVGYMPESDCYVPGMTGVRFVAYAGQLSGLPRRAALTRAHEVLYYVGLGESRYRKADEYSQGMRQRLRLAQALVHDPDLLFLDEPTSGLDPGGRAEMIELVTDLAERQKKHVVLSSHLLPDVEEVCEFVVVLSDGRVVKKGPLGDFRHRSRGEYEIRVKGDAKVLAVLLARDGIEVTDRDGDRLRAIFPADTLDLFRAAREAKVQVRELNEVSSTLEDAFLEMVQGGPDEAT